MPDQPFKSNIYNLSPAEQEKLFLLTFENAAVGMAHVDRDGHFLRINNKLAEITGYPKDELLKKTFQEITYPEDLDEDLRQAGELVRGQINSYTMEKRYYKKDGNVVWVKLTGSTIKDDLAEPKIFIAIVEDISMKKKAEEALRENEEKLQMIADNISQLVWMGDSKGRIYWCNKRWIDYTGLTHQDLEGWGWEKLVHPEHLERIRGTLKKAWINGESWEDLFQIEDKNEQYRWFLAKAIPLYDKKKKIVRWFGTATDVTKQREFEIQLKKDAELIENLLYILAHDLKGPIANLNMASDLIEEVSSKDRIKIISQLKIISKQMQKTINGVTEILKVQKKDSSAAQKVFFKDVLNQVFDEFNDRLDLDAITCKFSQETIFYNESLLYSMMKNLIDNSLKYRRDNVDLKIMISTSIKDDYILLRYSDNGIGIDLDKHGNQLFSPFKRFTPQKAQGTGIGLYIIKNIVEKNGGYINLESDLDEGTTFYCYLKEF